MDGSERRFQKAIHKAVENKPWQRVWYVYEDYYFENHDNETFVLASESSPPHLYAPLKDPHLFLRFARLVPEDGGVILPEVMLDWAKKYGLLGATGGDVPLRLLARERAVSLTEGRAESLAHFSRCAVEAARTLALYEALKAPRGPDVKTLAKMYSRGESMTLDELEEEALNEVWRRVRNYLETGSYLMVYELEDGFFGEGPGFHSLLAAMWIQMWWLLKTGDNLTHCINPNCHSIIDYEMPPTPYQRSAVKKKGRKRPPYKTRDDKAFCDKRCYQRWRYHEKKAGRSGRLADI